MPPEAVFVKSEGVAATMRAAAAGMAGPAGDLDFALFSGRGRLAMRAGSTSYHDRGGLRLAPVCRESRTFVGCRRRRRE